jgi:hypothetical protein
MSGIQRAAGAFFAVVARKRRSAEYPRVINGFYYNVIEIICTQENDKIEYKKFTSVF